MQLSLFAIVVFIADIIAIIDCMNSSLTSSKKLLWVILIIFAPLLGVILYFVIRRK